MSELVVTLPGLWMTIDPSPDSAGLARTELVALGLPEDELDRLASGADVLRFQLAAEHWHLGYVCLETLWRFRFALIVKLRWSDADPLEDRPHHDQVLAEVARKEHAGEHGLESVTYRFESPDGSQLVEVAISTDPGTDLGPWADLADAIATYVVWADAE